MHWVLQENIFQEDGWNRLVDTLDRLSIPYSTHKVVPFIGELQPDINPEGPVICFGSYSMRHAAKAKNWYPGVFDLFDKNFLVQKKHWGDRMLNYDSTIVAFKDAKLTEPKFIRPIDDSKYFAGKVFDPDEFHKWQTDVCDLNLDFGSSLSPDTLIQICEPKTIYQEVRLWVVNRHIVTASVYKVGSRVVYSNNVDRRFIDFGYTIFGGFPERLAGWKPDDAFVIDVCETPEGMKIVEINTINSSGFYAGDVQKLVIALEYAFDKHPSRLNALGAEEYPVRR
jgi:hypothetical protein